MSYFSIDDAITALVERECEKARKLAIAETFNSIVRTMAAYTGDDRKHIEKVLLKEGMGLRGDS